MEVPLLLNLQTGEKKMLPGIFIQFITLTVAPELEEEDKDHEPSQKVSIVQS
jgi:hypothetical protein